MRLQEPENNFKPVLRKISSKGNTCSVFPSPECSMFSLISWHFIFPESSALTALDSTLWNNLAHSQISLELYLPINLTLGDEPQVSVNPVTLPLLPKTEA